jgi:hypothetical protein
MNSSWIDSILYKRTTDGSYLAVFLKDTAGVQSQAPFETTPAEPVAFLYGGPESPIPSWIPGLLAAGTGRRSVGLAYNKLLKGKYSYQRVEGRENVEALKEMMS